MIGEKEKALVRSIVDDPVTALKQGTVTLLKENRYQRASGYRGKWKSLVMVSNADPGIVIKIFYPGSFPRRMYYFRLGRDPLAVAARLPRLLHGIVDSPEVICHGRSGSAVLPEYSYIAWRALNGVVLYLQAIEHYLDANDHSSSARAVVMQHVVRQLAQLHHHGFFHGDLNPTHVYVADNAEDFTEQRWILIDLDEGRLRPRIRLREIVKNLYQVWGYFIDPFHCASLEELCRVYVRQTSFSRCSAARLQARVERMLAIDGHPWRVETPDITS